MTRRKFIRKLIKAGSAILGIRSWMLNASAKAVGGSLKPDVHRAWGWRDPEQQAIPKLRLRLPHRYQESSVEHPRKFVRAVRLKKYPGSLRPLRYISKSSKWSG